MPERITVASLVRPDLLTFTPETPVNHAVARLLARNVSGAPVVDRAGGLVGVITAKDCFRAALQASYHQNWTGLVADFMSAPVETLDAETDIVTAAQRFLDSAYRRFPVMRDGRLIGVVTRLDVLRAINALWTGA